MVAVTPTPPISCVLACLRARVCACVRACGRVMCPASDPLPSASILAQDPATLFVLPSLTGYSSRRNQFITQVVLLAGRTHRMHAHLPFPRTLSDM